MKYPQNVQEELIWQHLEKAKHTEFGKKYDFKSIKSIREFKERIPIHSYENLKPYVERLMKGEQNILWPTETKWFAKSSGTTSDRSKFIPVTKEALEDCHYKGGKDLFCLYHVNNPNSHLYKGKYLAMGGSSEQINWFNKSYSGDLSAIIIKNLPFWAEARRTPNKKIALMDGWEDKIEKLAKSTMKEDVYHFAGVPSWSLVLLKRILELNNTNSIHDVWPNFELFMHGGVNFEPYRAQFEDIFSKKKVNYYQNYTASEGFFGVQDQNEADDMLLMLDYGIYYEFIPIEYIHEDHPKSYSLEEVEAGINYAIVISTNAGLWRYMIGDTITFTNLSPFKIKVTGRTKLFINAFGEELIIDNADKAMSSACKYTGAKIKDYTAGPVYMSKNSQGCHEWIIEFETKPENLEIFRTILDEELKSVNSDYNAKRSADLTLKKPILKIAPNNTFYNWLKDKGRLGGQNKIPRLSNNRVVIEDIYKFMDGKENTID